MDERLPGWVTLLRAPNPGPMTLDGTNTWVVRGPGATHAYVIDPGPLDDAHLTAIAELGPYRRILVTHGHFDHVEGAARLSAMLGGVPVSAADPEHTLHGDVLTPGELPDEGVGVSVDVLATPGHTGDSVCFLARHGNDTVMFTGDTILGRGTTVVAWPDGDLSAYLDSLAVLAGHDGVPLLPGHGPVLPDCGAVARMYQEHRGQRLAQVRAAMAAGADSPEAVVDLVYPDIDPSVRFAALWSAQAQLDHLRRESPPGVEQLDPL